ncbi:MAG: MerR family transcriptional regulator [Firmicutes bacterium]|nr:MerR family transcriptional regulator [Bacillota bacterium]
MKEVTRITGATESALRYYNAKGVLSPTVRENTGRRQWLYDDETVGKLKKLFLLKYIGVSIEEAGIAICEEKEFRRTIMKSLEELKKERDKLELQIFIAQTLALSDGMDLLTADDEMDEDKKLLLNSVIRECIKEGAK